MDFDWRDRLLLHHLTSGRKGSEESTYVRLRGLQFQEQVRRTIGVPERVAFVVT